jgi:hypothetical protein
MVRKQEIVEAFPVVTDHIIDFSLDFWSDIVGKAQDLETFDFPSEKGRKLWIFFQAVLALHFRHEFYSIAVRFRKLMIVRDCL